MFVMRRHITSCHMFWNISWILATVWLRNARVENVWISSVWKRFRSTFVKLFRSFYLVFPGRRLSITFDIQIDLKLKHSWKPLQRYTQNHVKHPIWRFCVNNWQLHLRCLARFWIHLCSSYKLVKKAPSQIFDRIMNSLWQPLTIFAKRFT